MNEMNLVAVDLNLLKIFDALLRERSVSRAARQLGLTQPAVSHALGRLRDLLGDPVLVRAGGSMQPTARALALAPAVAQALQQIAAALAPPAPFVAAGSTHRFIFAMSDYAAFLLGPALLRRLRGAAPQATAVIRTASRALGFAMLEANEAELIIGNFPHPPASLKGEDLGSDDWVCTFRNGHPALVRTFDLDAYTALQHLNVSLRGEAGGLIEDALADIGRQRQVVATVGHFLIVPYLVAGSDLVATEPRRIVEAMATALGLVTRAPPFQARPFPLTQMWHRRNESDKAHLWLRETVRSVAAEVFAGR